MIESLTDEDGGEQAIAKEIYETTRQAAKIKRKSLLLTCSRDAISGILIKISLPLFLQK
jgi:hypothetical protein